VQNAAQQKSLVQVQKAEIADVFWSRFTPETKMLFKQEAREINTMHGLTGKRRMTAFWLFATILMKHLGHKKSTDSLLVDAIFHSLQTEEKEGFRKLEMSNSNKRHVTFLGILQTETSLRVI